MMCVCMHARMLHVYGGAVLPILAAGVHGHDMDTHASQHHACAALCNAARDRSSLPVSRHGGLELVLSAIEAFPHDTELVEVASKAVARCAWPVCDSMCVCAGATCDTVAFGRDNG